MCTQVKSLGERSFEHPARFNDEAYPVLLSANTWVANLAREGHMWLFGLGLQGHNTLRKIILEADYGIHAWGFQFEIFNTLPSCTELMLTIRAMTPILTFLYRNGTMK